MGRSQQNTKFATVVLFKVTCVSFRDILNCISFFFLTPSGFCDGDLTNDLTLPNGTVLGVSKDPTLFIDSWQVPNTTSYVSYSRRREHNCSTSDCSRCLAMLEDNTFTRCHEFVCLLLTPFYAPVLAKLI